MAEKNKGMSWGKRFLLGGLALLGVGLLALGSFLPDASKKSQASSSAENDGTEVQSNETYLYSKTISEEIEKLCAEVVGVENVHAAVSLDGGFTYTYAANREQREDGDASQSSDTYITVGSGSSESTVPISVTPPKIVGIGIVCRGGGDPYVRNELIALLSAAYDIGSNRIYITEAK